MITAEFFIKNKQLVGFSVSGHAGYANHGSDIVCASVSSAVQLTCNNITEIFHIKADVKVLNDNDKIKLTIPCYDDKAAMLIEGLKLHLTLLSEDYKGTINITSMEV